MIRIWMGVREFGAIALFAVLLWTAVLTVRRLTGRRHGVTWPLAFAVMLGWESILLNLLSIGRWVTPFAVTVCNLAAVAAVTAWLGHPLRLWRREASLAAGALRHLRAAWMIAPLAVLLALTAYFYPPNTYDSMTYHMARVAHWIQNQSVAFYPTSIDRQNWMSPGAEYLILMLQLLAGTDQWANIVQFAAWLVAVCSMPSLCRMAGVPRSLCPWAAVFVAGLPMGIMQATSTQTDMVAAAMTLAAVSAVFPLFRRVRRWQVSDVGLLVVALSSGLLVKQTAPLAAVSFLGLFGWVVLRSAADVRQRVRFLVAAGAAAVVLAGAIYGPHVLRLRAHEDKPEYTDAANIGKSAYSLGEWHGARLFNPILATYAQHNFGRAKVARWCSRLAARMGMEIEPSRLRRHQVLKISEDFVGNPLQFWTGCGLFVWLLWAWRRLSSWRRCIALAPFVSWVVFHWFIRDAIWVSRVQLPLFFLLPLGWCALAARVPGVRLARLALMGMSVLGLSYGFYAATHNETKELYPGELFHVDRDSGYYKRNWVKPRDDAALAALRSVGGRHLGLYFGISEYEYPLTWRALRAGFNVRHYTSPSPWPDVILSMQGRPPAAPGREPWVLKEAVGDYQLYVAGAVSSSSGQPREAHP